MESLAFANPKSESRLGENRLSEHPVPCRVVFGRMCVVTAVPEEGSAPSPSELTDRANDAKKFGEANSNGDSIQLTEPQGQKAPR